MIKGVIFDKDGTLFDFNATWGAWARRMLEAEAAGDGAVLARLADVLGFDLESDRFRPGSIVIAESVGIVADAMLTVLRGKREALIARMNAVAVDVPQVEAAPLTALFAELREAGLTLGVVTNDAEMSAQAHLDRAGIRHRFAFVAGADSGYGAKPGPGQLLAFCAATGIAPDRCLMVGDSTHDLVAGRAAGMRTFGVLTGPARAFELAPHADAVRASIADLPGWLAGGAVSD